MLRLLTRVLIAGGLLAALSSAPAAASPAIGGVSARPTAIDGRPAPAGASYVEVERPSPSQFTTTVEVTNATDRAIPVRVAAVDTTTSENGGTAFLATAAPRRGTGAWISPGQQRLMLGANSTTRLEFKVRIPKGADPGDHVGGIVIEPERRVRLDSAAAITRVVRVALAVHVRVPGRVRREIEVTAPRFARGGAAAGAPLVVTVRLANTGDVLCRPDLTATFSVDGRVRSAERRHVDTLLPATTIDLAIRWSRPVPDGAYDLQIRAEGCGTPSAVQERVSIEGAKTLGVATPSAAAVPPPAGLPRGAGLGALAALLLGAGAAGWWIAGRRAHVVRADKTAR